MYAAKYRAKSIVAAPGFRAAAHNGIEIRARLGWWREWQGWGAGLYLVGLMDLYQGNWPGGHLTRLDGAVVDDFGNLVPVEVRA